MLEATDSNYQLPTDIFFLHINEVAHIKTNWNICLYNIHKKEHLNIGISIIFACFKAQVNTYLANHSQILLASVACA